MRRSMLLAMLLSAAPLAPTSAQEGQPVATRAPIATMTPAMSVAGEDIAAMQAAMEAGTVSSADLVREYLRRIADMDDAGPTLNAVIATYPDALAEADSRDAERRSGRLRGPLHGIPILIKDNIEAIGPLPTTAGSLALATNITGRDAPLVARLRAAGAIILGRTNLSEWANIRDGGSTSGWSAIGGLTRNPHSLDRTACGSSSGSGAAMAARLAAATVGTETDGSVICPSSINGIVGFKPTLGLVSRRYIVPVSASQDTAGPMTGSVRDAAIMLTAMAGSDPQDAATAEANRRRTDYAATLSATALSGMRIGVLRGQVGDSPAIASLFNGALEALRAQGAVLVDITDDGFDRSTMGQAELTVLISDLRDDLNAYLGDLPAHLTDVPRSLEAVIAFNRAEPRELRWFGQRLFEQAAATQGRASPGYAEARATSLRLAGAEGIDRLLRTHNVALLVAPSGGPAWSIDLVNGDHFTGPSMTDLPAIAGYPHLTVPMGAIEGLPIGLSFIGTRWDDARVLAAGHDFELATRDWRPVPSWRARLDAAAPLPTP